MSLKRAREVITIEAQAVKDLLGHLDRNFLSAIDLICRCRGRVIVTGMGKTGIVGRKIASTLSSTGTPSIWMHSAEAVHGDLGQVTKNDVLILLSSSGETEEAKRLLPLVKKIGAKIIAMTGNSKSTLARHSDVALDVSVKKEGCPLGLAPMASTTVTLVMGDALAACLIDRKGFKKEDFAFYHPGGSLGRKLLLKVEDIMRKGNFFPKVKENSIVKNVLLDNFKESLEFVNKVGEISERLNHHPYIIVKYNVVKLILATHSVGSLTKIDFDVAKEIDKLENDN